MSTHDVVTVAIHPEHRAIVDAMERGEPLTNEQARRLKSLMWEQTEYFRHLAAERYIKVEDAEYKLKRIGAYVSERLSFSQIDRPLALALARIHAIMEGE